MNTVSANQEFAALAELGPDQAVAAAEDMLLDLGDAIEEDRTPQRHTVLIGPIGLILPANEISELIEKVTICGMPNTCSWFSGVVGIRGNMIPVFDLHDLFSIERPASDRHLIAVGQNETAAAFWVDGFPDLLKFADEDISTDKPQVPEMILEHAKQYYQKDGQAWVEWDYKTFFEALGEQL